MMGSRPKTRPSVSSKTWIRLRLRDESLRIVTRPINAPKCSWYPLNSPAMHSYRDKFFQAYISSYSSSSSSAGAGGCFFLRSSFRSRGQVELSLSQGRMQSRSNRWSLWQGSRTTSGYSSAKVRISQTLAYPSFYHQLYCPNLPSRNGFTQIGHVSVGFNDFFGTRSSSSRKLSGHPFNSVGGSSAFCLSTSIMLASKSSPPP